MRNHVHTGPHVTELLRHARDFLHSTQTLYRISATPGDSVFIHDFTALVKRLSQNLLHTTGNAVIVGHGRGQRPVHAKSLRFSHLRVTQSIIKVVSLVSTAFTQLLKNP